MQDEPSSAELLAAAITFLRERALPALDGPLQFEARVTANALDIVQRQMRLGPAMEYAEAARLRSLLSMQGDLETMNREMCHRIANGSVSLETNGLREHLRQTALDKLAIDQPGYATRADILNRGWTPGTTEAHSADQGTRA